MSYIRIFIISGMLYQLRLTNFIIDIKNIYCDHLSGIYEAGGKKQHMFQKK